MLLFLISRNSGLYLQNILALVVCERNCFKKWVVEPFPLGMRGRQLLGGWMKLFIILFLFFSTLNAFARGAIDERIYICETGSQEKYLGKNEKYRVHVIAGQKMKFTRLSDKKWFLTETNGSGYYVFVHSDKGGNFWPGNDR